MKLNKVELRENLNDIFLEIILSDSIVCFTNLDDNSYEKSNLIEFINYVKKNIKLFLILLEEKSKNMECFSLKENNCDPSIAIHGNVARFVLHKSSHIPINLKL